MLYFKCNCLHESFSNFTSVNIKLLTLEGQGYLLIYFLNYKGGNIHGFKR